MTASLLCHVLTAVVVLFSNSVVGLPAGFIDEGLTKFGDLTGIGFANTADDGYLIMVASRPGRVLIMEDDPLGQSAPTRMEALDLTDVTCTEGERGLCSIVAHPDFANNGWVYIYYTFKGDSQCEEDRDVGPRNRCSRFTMNADHTIDRDSEVVLFETSRLQNKFHNSGDMSFGNDGFLWVAVGDGGMLPERVAEERGDLLGTMVRITDQGGIPPDNPYANDPLSARCNVGGIPPAGSPPDTVCQEMYAYGLRNPFRFSMDPNTPDDSVRFLLSDVGGKSWEEVNVGGTDYAGANYGWPTREGPCRFRSSVNCLLEDVIQGDFLDPIHYYNHDADGGGCAVGVVIPPRGLWPSEYDDSFLLADFVWNKIHHMIPTPDESCRDCIPPRSIYTNTTFHEWEDIVDLKFGPHYQNGRVSQALYYTTRSRDSNPNIRRIFFEGGANRSPIAGLTSSATVVSANEAITFDASESTDPDGDPLTYEWRFGDGTQYTAGAIVTHQYSAEGPYSVFVEVFDAEGFSDEAFVDIVVGDPPIAEILTPVEGERFAVGDIFTVSGVGADGQGNVLPPENLTWEVRQHHNTHFHPFLAPTVGNNITLTPAPQPEDFQASGNSFVKVLLTVTDSNGLSTTVERDIMPKTVWLDFDSVPTGLELSLEGELLVMPLRVLSWENHNFRLIAEDQPPYEFVSWSDGGEQIHVINVPPNTSEVPLIVAQFRDTTPTVRPTGAPFTPMPSDVPSSSPSDVPISSPSASPFGMASSAPSLEPTSSSSGSPSLEPTATPTSQPSGIPSAAPSVGPTSEPSKAASAAPSLLPTDGPTLSPTTGSDARSRLTGTTWLAVAVSLMFYLVAI